MTFSSMEKKKQTKIRIRGGNRTTSVLYTKVFPSENRTTAWRVHTTVSTRFNPTEKMKKPFVNGFNEKKKQTRTSEFAAVAVNLTSKHARRDLF